MQEENPANKKPLNSNNAEDEDSEWSLESLQELKGMSLNDLREEEDIDPIATNKQGLGNINKKMPAVAYPPMQELTAQSQLHEVGQVIGNVGELYVVEVQNIANIVDLDNWLFDGKRQLVGFVIDIFGRVDKPYYAVKLREGISEMPEIVGQKLHFGDGCKTLTQDDIKSIRAKSSVDLDGAQDSSDQQDNEQPNNMCSQPNYPQNHHHPRVRRRSFQEEPINQRQRTREKRNRPRHEPNDREYGNNNRRGFSNQAYLENMYSTYYNQMMQLYQQGQPMPPPIPPHQFNMNQQQSSQNPISPQNTFPPRNNQLPGWPQPPQQFHPHQGNRPFPTQ